MSNVRCHQAHLAQCTIGSSRHFWRAIGCVYNSNDNNNLFAATGNNNGQPEKSLHGFYWILVI